MSDYKVNKLSADNRPWSDDPRGLNYKTGLTTRLDPIYTLTKGRLIQADWFTLDENGAHDELIVRALVTYYDHPDGRVDYRSTRRLWTVEGGAFGEIEKISIKPYDERMSNREAMRRRTNIVDGLRDQTTLFGVKDQFLEMYRDLFLDIQAYQNEGDTALINQIAIYKLGQDEGLWLEAPVPDTPFTLRQAIIGALTI